MSFRDWLKQLEKYGSANDPIWRHGIETTPSALAEYFPALNTVDNIRIIYFAGRPARRKKGTARGMLRDRVQNYL